MGRNWYTDFNIIMFTKIKNKLTAKLGGKYKNLNTVRYSKSVSRTVFPTIYIPDPDKVGMGSTFDMTIPNAINCTYQPEIYAKTSDEAEMLATALEEVFCEMKFHVRISNTDMDSGLRDIYRRVGKYQRIIAGGDIL